MLYGLDKNGNKILAETDLKAICPQCKSKLISKCGLINIWHWAHDNKLDCDSWRESETEWHIDWKKQFPKNQTEVVIEKYNNIHRADAVTKNGVVIEFQNSSISPFDIKIREDFYTKMIWIINGNNFFTNFKFDGFDLTINKLTFKNIFWHSPYNSDFIAIKITNLNVKNWKSLNRILSETKQYQYISEFDCYHYKPEFIFNRSLPNDLLNEFLRSIYEIEIISDNLKIDLKFKWKNLRKVWNVAKMPIFVDFNNGYLLYIKKLYDSGIGYGKFVTKEMILNKYAC